MEVYQNHLGGFYFEELELDDDYLYCDQCGDSDYHLGHADTWEDVLDLITEVDGDGSEWCPYAEDYLEEMKVKFAQKIRQGEEDKR